MSRNKIMSSSVYNVKSVILEKQFSSSSPSRFFLKFGQQTEICNPSKSDSRTIENPQKSTWLKRPHSEFRTGITSPSPPRTQCTPEGKREESEEKQVQNLALAFWI